MSKPFCYEVVRYHEGSDISQTLTGAIELAGGYNAEYNEPNIVAHYGHGTCVDITDRVTVDTTTKGEVAKRIVEIAEGTISHYGNAPNYYEGRYKERLQWARDIVSGLLDPVSVEIIPCGPGTSACVVSEMRLSGHWKTPEELAEIEASL